MAQLSFEDESNNIESTIDTSELDVPDVGTSIIAEIELPDIETIDVGGVEDAQIETYLDVIKRKGVRPESGYYLMEELRSQWLEKPLTLDSRNGECVEPSLRESCAGYVLLDCSASSNNIDNLIEQLGEIARQQKVSEGDCDWKSRVSRLYWDSASSIRAYGLLRTERIFASKLQSVARYLSDYISSLRI